MTAVNNNSTLFNRGKNALDAEKKFSDTLVSTEKLLVAQITSLGSGVSTDTDKVSLGNNNDDKISPLG